MSQTEPSDCSDDQQTQSSTSSTSSATTKTTTSSTGSNTSSTSTSTKDSTESQESEPLQDPLPPNAFDPTSGDPELLFRSFLNEREATGRTATFIAVEVNRPKCLETLLAFRADPNIPNLKGITPLQLACERGFQTCIRVLVRNHASCRTSHGKNLVELIWESVKNLDERAELLAYLIASGAQCEVQRLDTLIQTLPTQYQGTFRKAVAEASILLQTATSPPPNPQYLHPQPAMSADIKDIVNGPLTVDPFNMKRKTPPIGDRNDEDMDTITNPTTSQQHEAMVNKITADVVAREELRRAKIKQEKEKLKKLEKERLEKEAQKKKDEDDEEDADEDAETEKQEGPLDEIDQ